MIIYICLDIDYLKLDNSVRNTERSNSAQSRCSHCGRLLTNRERIREIRYLPSINATLIIILPNVTVGNHIRASDVDWRVTSLQIFQNQTLLIRKFTGTWKILKLVRTDQRKQIRHWTTVYIKKNHRRYTHLRNVCFIIQKFYKRYCRYFATDQLDFRLKCDL